MPAAAGLASGEPSSQVAAPDPTTASAIRVRAGSPTAILAIVPYLLGFVPESSIVVIGTERTHGTVKVTLRYDLPDPADMNLAAEIAGHALAVLGSQRLSAAIAVGYGPDTLVRPLAVAFRDAAAAGNVGVMEFLRVEDGRYWSYTCANEACCPAAGTPFDVDGHAATAVMASDGKKVLADRGAVAASIAPLAGVAAESMRQATRRAEQRVTRLLAKVRKSAHLGAARHAIATDGLAAVARMIATYRSGGRYATDYELAWLTVVLKDIRVRDDAWARMDPEYRDAHLRLWTDVVRRAQPGHVAAPASLLAFVAWQAGNGALANVALDRALTDRPGYSMAMLLRQVISAGAPPSMARLPMTPEEVAACYDGLDQDAGEDDEDYAYGDFDEDYGDEEDEEDEEDDVDDDDYTDDGDQCPCGTSPSG